jgi:hypothetical protein
LEHERNSPLKITERGPYYGERSLPQAAVSRCLDASLHTAKRSLFCLSFCGSPAVFQSRFHAYAMHGSGPFPLSTLKGSYNKIFNPEMLH